MSVVVYKHVVVMAIHMHTKFISMRASVNEYIMITKYS